MGQLTDHWRMMMRLNNAVLKSRIARSGSVSRLVLVLPLVALLLSACQSEQDAVGFVPTELF